MAGTAAAALAPTDHLTPFDGKAVLRTTISITNAGDGLSDALSIDPQELHHGEKVYVVMECEVAKVRFDPIKDAPDHLTRAHVLRAGTATLVDAPLVADVLDRQRLAIEKAREEAAGISKLPWADETAEAMAAEHLDGQHASGLRDGCPECDAEREAAEMEADNG